MEFVLGIMTCLCGLLLYDKFKSKKTEAETLSEEETKKQKEIEDHYNNILNYNQSKAYGGKSQ